MSEASVINLIAKAVRDPLFTLELDEDVFLDTRLEQVNVYHSSDEFAIRVAFFVC